jgi:hypothetical protein
MLPVWSFLYIRTTPRVLGGFYSQHFQCPLIRGSVLVIPLPTSVFTLTDWTDLKFVRLLSRETP